MPREEPVTIVTFPESSTLPPIKLVYQPALPFRCEVPQAFRYNFDDRARAASTSPVPALPASGGGVLDTRLSCTIVCQEH